MDPQAPSCIICGNLCISEAIELPGNWRRATHACSLACVLEHVRRLDELLDPADRALEHDPICDICDHEHEPTVACKLQTERFGAL